MSASHPAPARRRLPVLQGIVPISLKRVPADIAAGATLAALGIPEVMGYTSIAGMPVITGLYTILIPIAVFALIGSSRHLVVGADSATAAIMAAGLAGLAPIASPQYIQLAGALAIITGLLLILARIARLGFIADFLSRSVLIGFLTGVGIQVALGQVGDMLGIPAPTFTKIWPGSSGTLEKFAATMADIGAVNGPTIWVSVAVLVLALATKIFAPSVPGALIAVVGAIFVSWKFDLASLGVATLGHVPSGLPQFGIPGITWAELPPLLSTAVALFVVILAQSAATSRAYAAKFEEQFSENTDLVGLSLANVSAGLTGTFVVNGSPTKTQMVTGAGGRSQIAQLTTAVIVLLVLLFLTAPLAFMPTAVLAAVVFLIGVELIDVDGLRHVWRVRRGEFVVAVLTALVVVTVGVEQAIILAIILSIITHLSHGYRPTDGVIITRSQEMSQTVPVAAGTTSEPGLVVYRFAASLYFANANRFNEEMLTLVGDGAPAVRWLVIDASAMSDIDYSGGETLLQASSELEDRGVRLALANVAPSVRVHLDRCGITALLGEDAYYDTMADAVVAFRAAPPVAAAAR
ncbi:SulP family inorganic anion transporter [Microbacterium rhizomatis]|uniref:SulP family inorganic anion transporter n=1 Tax=Microbacterium rhizomatis TaxID=1631477 RepID=A0A5J5J0X4_9MICO|nr:SulP family inorganic anion transporter [Microbacterium rhizomatis]KAA9107634.1 SulP family inorganic anion transporter [Microbacterium rhizomatis]